MPLPFMRSMGVGGLLVPLVSIAASATFLPALLAVMGRRVNRLRVDPAGACSQHARAGPSRASGRAWRARSCAGRSSTWSSAGGLMLALAAPGAGAPPDERRQPRRAARPPRRRRGLALLRGTLGPGALAPNQIVVDTRRARRRAGARRGRRPAALRRGAAPRPRGRAAARSRRPRCRGRPGRRAGVLRRLEQANLLDAARPVHPDPRRGRERRGHRGGQSTSSTASATATCRRPASAPTDGAT